MNKHLTNKFVLDLISAEEAFLKSLGWVQVARRCRRSAQLWRSPEFAVDVTRAHAIAFEKARHPNFGI
jgi:hypothetical protein